MTEIPNWEHVPDNIKSFIVDKMDIVTRCRFKQCSKATKSLVESRPLQFAEVICDVKYGGEGDDDYIYSLSFDGFKREKVGFCREDETGHNVPLEIMTIFNEQVSAANIPMDYLKMTWDFPAQFSESGQFIRVKTIQFNCTTQKQHKIWLDHMIPGVKCVIFDNRYSFENDEPDIGMHPILINAKTLDLNNQFPLSDAHLGLYKATTLHYCYGGWTFKDVDLNVTVFGIVGLLKRWIKEDYPIGATFEMHVCGNNSKDIQSVIPLVHGFFYSMKKRSYDNKITIKVMMNAEKYIELVPFREFEHWHVKAIVRSVEVIEEKEVVPNWNNLPPEIKTMIVKRMDIFTRNRLKVCSKSDKALVESIPFHYSTMTTCGNGHYLFQIDDFLAIKCYGDEYTDVYEGKPNEDEEKCNVKRRIVYNSEEEALNIWKKVFHSFVKNEKVKIDYCELDPCDGENLMFEPDGIGALSVIMNAKKVFNKSYEMAETELLALKATDFKCRTEVFTQKSINLLIKKWIQEDYPVGSKLHIFYKLVEKYEEIYEGLEYVKLNEPLGDFEYEKAMINMGNGKSMKLTIKRGGYGWTIMGTERMTIGRTVSFSNLAAEGIIQNC